MLEILKKFASPLFSCFLTLATILGIQKHSLVRKAVDRIPPVSFISLIRDDAHFFYYSNRLDDLNKRARTNLDGWEANTRKIWSKLCSRKDYILDVGSYSGIYSIIARKSQSNAIVVALEPNYTFYKIARINFLLNFQSICIYNMAALNSAGTSTFYSGTKHGVTSTSSFMKPLDLSLYLPDTVSHDCLDSISAKIDLMKIDCEGSELQVLQGAQRNLQENTPIIIFESLDTIKLHSIRAFLNVYGYSFIYEIDPRKHNYITWTLNDSDLMNEVLGKIS